MATDYAQNLNTSVVLLHKTRQTGAEAHVTHLVGDVRGRSCLVVDDMISTGGTLPRPSTRVVEMGTRPEMVVAATHGVLLGRARAKLTAPPIGDVFVTDSIEQHTEGWPRLHVISVAPFLADAIRSADCNDGYRFVIAKARARVSNYSGIIYSSSAAATI